MTAPVDPSTVVDSSPKDTWTTEELREDFEVIAFAAPFVVVKRRRDGASGTLEFSHNPRVYYGWVEDAR